MSAWEWILNILLFIVALGVLITIHELGHFSMAKLFNVYCHEFSIGFGPKLLQKKKKGGETTFSIRAIPLGGYVSMYGEDVEPIEGMPEIPASRSLEGIKKWKKAIVLSAGICLNAVLALLLLGVSNICFPDVLATNQANVNEISYAHDLGIKSEDKMFIIGPSTTQEDLDEGFDPKRIDYDYENSDGRFIGSFYVIDDSVTLNGMDYVLTYYPTGTKTYTSFVDGIKLYPATDLNSSSDVNKSFSEWTKRGETLQHYPDFVRGSMEIVASSSFTANVGFNKFIEEDAEGNYKYDDAVTNYSINIEAISEGNDEYAWKDIGLEFKTIDIWYPFWTRVGNTFIDFGDASSAVFVGLGSLFTEGTKNISGVIGIFNQSATILSSYPISTFLYFWALISVNLAIFNLLPFPGLDGWALLVTAIEGISKKKIPAKVKNIVSLVGLIVLFGFMILVVILDIVKLF